MDDIAYDEIADSFYFRCGHCGKHGPYRMHEIDAEHDGEQHDAHCKARPDDGGNT